MNKQNIITKLREMNKNMSISYNICLKTSFKMNYS